MTILIALIILSIFIATRKEPLKFIKENAIALLIVLIVLMLLIYFFSKQILNAFNWLKSLFTAKPKPNDTAQGNSLTQSQIETIISKFKVAFNSAFTTDNDILQILQPLTENDYLTVKNQFGLWFYEANTGVLANDWLSLQFGSYNLTECIQLEVSAETWQQIKNKFPNILI